MHTAKLQATKFKAVFPIFLKCHNNRHMSKACLKANHIYERQPGRQEQTYVTNNHDILADKLKDCKTQLTSYVDPVKKYEYLADLRDQNVELYYHYLCHNTVEVFSVLTAVDGIADKFYRLGAMLINRFRRNDVIIKQMDISSTVDLLRQKVNAQRQEAKAFATTSSAEKMLQHPPLANVAETSGIRKQFMIYLQKKHGKK